MPFQKKAGLKKAIFLCLVCFCFNVACAQESERPNLYKDKNGFFAFLPPPDWKLEETITPFRTKISLRSPDNSATLGIIAELDGGNINDLLLQKKDFIRYHQTKYPEGKYDLSRTKLNGLVALKMEFEMPKVSKQEFYFFFAKGIRFDLVYGVADPDKFENYKEKALDVFSTIKPLDQVIMIR